MRHTYLTLGVLALLVLAILTGTARADGRVIGLGALIAQSDRIIIGTVTQVEPGVARGSHVATFAVQEHLKGAGIASLRLPGSEIDPSLNNFHVGVQFLAFLRAVPGGYAQVGGLHGMVEIPRDRLPAVRNLTMDWITKSATIRLADMRDDMATQENPASGLLFGAMLEEMTLRLAPADYALVAEMACDSAKQFLAPARQWAIGRVGPARITQARPCVEQLLAADEDLGARIAAAETLGALADSRSLTPLVNVATGDEEDPLIESAVLAIGKLRQPSAIPTLAKLATGEGDLGLHSTLVNALGLIGKDAVPALTDISTSHPAQLIRDQAKETLQVLARQ
jgi:hypothetical protein